MLKVEMKNYNTRTCCRPRPCRLQWRQPATTAGGPSPAPPSPNEPPGPTPPPTPAPTTEPNRQPPRYSSHFDEIWGCQPCWQLGQNQCHFPVAGGGGDNTYDWLFQARQQAMARKKPPRLSSPVQCPCCSMKVGENGEQYEYCNIPAGCACGWATNVFPGQLYGCEFTTANAKYATLKECEAANPAPSPPPLPSDPTAVKWFPPCEMPNNATNCYFKETAGGPVTNCWNSVTSAGLQVRRIP